MFFNRKNIEQYVVLRAESCHSTNLFQLIRVRNVMVENSCLTTGGLHETCVLNNNTLKKCYSQSCQSVGVVVTVCGSILESVNMDRVAPLLRCFSRVRSSVAQALSHTDGPPYSAHASALYSQYSENSIFWFAGIAKKYLVSNSSLI